MNTNGYNYHSKIVTVDGDYNLYQGEPGDEIQMLRSIDELLECERSSVNKMLGGREQ
jgi:hypothetical protein